MKRLKTRLNPDIKTSRENEFLWTSASSELKTHLNYGVEQILTRYTRMIFGIVLFTLVYSVRNITSSFNPFPVNLGLVQSQESVLIFVIVYSFQLVALRLLVMGPYVTNFISVIYGIHLNFMSLLVSQKKTSL